MLDKNLGRGRGKQMSFKDGKKCGNRWMETE